MKKTGYKKSRDTVPLKAVVELVAPKFPCVHVHVNNNKTRPLSNQINSTFTVQLNRRTYFSILSSWLVLHSKKQSFPQDIIFLGKGCSSTESCI
jgi:hypothetical protein